MLNSDISKINQFSFVDTSISSYGVKDLEFTSTSYKVLQKSENFQKIGMMFHVIVGFTNTKHLASAFKISICLIIMIL